MQKSNEMFLKQAIEEMLKDYKIDDKYSEVRIQAMWQNIVGKVIAKHTKGIYLKNGKLYIILASAALREEITYSRTKLIDKINRKFGSLVVNEIIVK